MGVDFHLDLSERKTAALPVSGKASYQLQGSDHHSVCGALLFLFVVSLAPQITDEQMNSTQKDPGLDPLIL